MDLGPFEVVGGELLGEKLPSRHNRSVKCVSGVEKWVLAPDDIQDLLSELTS